MRKFSKPEPQTPINAQIRYEKLRVVDDNGQLGVMNKSQALTIAQSRGLDLIVITESATPPIAKILDANKYLYEQKRREKELAKKQRESRIEVKEIQFRPGIGDHDFETKIKNIEKFLSKGNKVKLMVRFKGRENANKHLGFQILERAFTTLEEAEWDAPPLLNGNRLIGILKRGKNG
jgi:translation initiation factor IF-3|tara:strand:- start:100 stop:633 length:534 start_codon:yes stop_codon:yes gene_type:complete